MDIVKYYYIANSSTVIRANVIQTYNTAYCLKKIFRKLNVIIFKQSYEINKIFKPVNPSYPVGIIFSKIFTYLKRYSRIWHYIEGSIASIIFFVILLKERKTRKVFYCREFIISFWLAMIICPILNGKLIYEAHGFETEEQERAKQKWFQPILRKMEEALFKKANVIVCITESSINKIINKKYKNNTSNVAIVRNGYDSKVFYPKDKLLSRKKLKLSPKSIYFVYAGLTFRYRNIDNIIFSASNLKQNTKIKFLIVGGQEDEINKYKQLVNKLNLNNVVDIVGKKNQKETADYMNAADFLIMPGVLSKEVSSPLKLFEYMAVRKPIICLDIPSHREILTSKDVIFYKKDQFHKTITKVLNYNNKKIFEYSLNAFRLSKQYTYEKRAKRILEIMLKEGIGLW